MFKSINFKSYFIFEKNKLFAYRINITGELISSIFVPLIIDFFLWKTILSSNEISYSFKKMMIYIVTSKIIFLFTQINADQNIEDDIKSKVFAQKIIRPVSYVVDLSLHHIMNSLIKFFVLYAPILIIALLIGGNIIYFEQILLFSVVLTLAFLINATISFCIGFLSFWITEIWGISAIRYIMLGLLSGTVFPIDIFPVYIQKISSYFPFQYISYIPAKVILDKDLDISIILKGIAISIIWIGIFTLISTLLYKRGINRYTVNGV